MKHRGCGGNVYLQRHGTIFGGEQELYWCVRCMTEVKKADVHNPKDRTRVVRTPVGAADDAKRADAISPRGTLRLLGLPSSLADRPTRFRASERF